MMVDSTDEQLLLGLLNSTPRTSGVKHDLLEETVAWQSWLRSDDGSVTKSAGRQALAAARAALQEVVRGTKPASVLSPFLRGARWVPAMAETGIEWSMEAPRKHSVAIRAVLAWDEISQRKPGRLRACENPDCDLFLLDRSKPNTARWCSMSTCGNRMKARRHYRSRPADTQ